MHLIYNTIKGIHKLYLELVWISWSLTAYKLLGAESIFKCWNYYFLYKQAEMHLDSSVETVNKQLMCLVKKSVIVVLSVECLKVFPKYY